MARIPLFPEETDTSPISGKQRSYDPDARIEVMKRTKTARGVEKVVLSCIRGVGCTACTRNPEATRRREWQARVRAVKKSNKELAEAGAPPRPLPPEPTTPLAPRPIQTMRIYQPKDPSNTEALLVVLSGQSFGDSANWLVYTIQQAGWTGWIVLDLAVKCGAGKPSDIHIKACAPYLKHTLKASGARRILVCGTPASKAVTGNTMHPWNHGSWTHLPSIDREDGEERGRTLVVAGPDPADAWRNRFVGNIMKAAVKRACFMDIPEGLPRDVVAETVVGARRLAQFMTWAKQVPYASYDVEWVGTPYNRDFKMVACSFSHPDWDVVWTFPEEALETPEVQAALREVLTTVPIVAQNIAAEFEASQCYLGVEIAEVHGDTLPGWKLLNVDSKAALEDLAYYIGHNSHKSEMDAAIAEVLPLAAARVPAGVGGANPKGYVMDLVDRTTMLRYNALDTYITGELHEELMRRFDIPKRKFLRGTYDNFIRPALKLLHRVHNTGMVIDRRALDVTRARLSENLDHVEGMLRHKGIDDPNSVAKIRQYLVENELFAKLEESLRYDARGKLVDDKVYERKLSKYKSAKTGEMSTGKKTLKMMKDWDGKGIIADLLEYRDKSKLLVAYGQALNTYIRDDGRIHPYYRIDGAKTGRLCVHETTLIPTSSGEMTPPEIARWLANPLQVPLYVRTHTGGVGGITASFCKGREAMMRITTTAGSIVCTAAHLLWEGDRWVAAGEVTVGCHLACSSGHGSRPNGRAVVTSVELLEGEHDVWDITVPGDHSYVAQGLVHHNSSYAPSSHQVPKHGENAALIKSVYVAPNGWVYVAFDYKTLEVFIAAIQSGDVAMMEACRQADFHLETAKKMAPYAWKCTPEQVEAEVKAGDKSKRSAAKGITFSILYGAGAYALADTLKCSIDVADNLLKAYAAAYPQFTEWVARQHAFAAEHGFVYVPWLGEPSRIRPLLHAGYTSPDDRGRFNQAMRQAVNTPVQGTAAQYGLLAAIDLEEQFRREKMPAAVNAMVHDSIMVECHPSVLDEVIPRMFHAMTRLPTGTDLRLQVDAEVGETWGSLEPIDLVPYVGVAG